MNLLGDKIKIERYDDRRCREKRKDERYDWQKKHFRHEPERILQLCTASVPQRSAVGPYEADFEVGSGTCEEE